MKKAILAALAMLPVVPLAADPVGDAELSPGAVELSGATALRLETGSVEVTPSGGAQTKTDTGSYALEASGFYYLARFAGLGLTVSYAKETEGSGDASSDAWAFLAGPAIALHLPVAPALAVFGRGTVGPAWARTWGGGGQADVSANGYGYAVEGGLKFFPLKQLSLDAGVSYRRVKLTTDEAVDHTGPMPVTIPKMDVVTAGLAFSAGLSVYLGR